MNFQKLLGDTLKGASSTVATADALKDVDVVGIYFSAHWCPPCRGFTPQLAELYKEAKAAGKSFEIVFVSSDRDEDSFNGYHAEQPWLALPFADRERKAALSEKYKVNGIPTLVLLDKKANLVTTSGRGIVEAGLSEYPWMPPTVEEMLGNKFVGQEGKELDSAALLGGADRVLGIYFSAHWCPPCRGFTPELAKKYKQLKAAGKNFEILFVSSDRDQAQFDEYFKEMPWTALPFENRKAKAKLSEHFEVEGIPTLVFWDCEKKKIINNSGRGAISGDSYLEDYPFYPKPVNDLAEGADGINDNVSLIVLDEKCDEATQKKVREVLESVAKAELAKEEDAQVVTRFFDGTGGPIVPQIRSKCSLGEAGDSPQMMILDLGDQGSYYVSGADGSQGRGEVTEKSVREVIDAFAAKSLSKKQMGN